MVHGPAVRRPGGQDHFTLRSGFVGVNPVRANQGGEGPGNGASWERGRPARTGAKRPEENAGGTPAFPGRRARASGSVG